MVNHAHRSTKPIPLATSLRSLTAGALLMVLGLGPITMAEGASFCVNTGNALFNALRTAESNLQSDEIRITSTRLRRVGEVGIIPRWPYYEGAGDSGTTLTISGGWNAGCTSQTLNPQLTELDAEAQGSALFLDMAIGSQNQSTVSISNLTITRGFFNGNLLGGRAAAANLGIDATFTNAQITLERLIIVAGNATVATAVAGIGVLAISDGSTAATITVRNNVIAYNNGDTAAGIDINANFAGVRVNNNSIIENLATSVASDRVGFNLINSGGFNYLANNLIHANADGDGLFRDLRILAGNTFLRNNHIGTANLVVAPTLNLGGTSGNPGYTLIGIFPTPNAGSPLLNSGNNNPTGGIGSLDLAGNPRIASSTVDRGAIEVTAGNPPPLDLIFRNGVNPG